MRRFMALPKRDCDRDRDLRPLLRLDLLAVVLLRERLRLRLRLGLVLRLLPRVTAPHRDTHLRTSNSGRMSGLAGSSRKATASWEKGLNTTPLPGVPGFGTACKCKHKNTRSFTSFTRRSSSRALSSLAPVTRLLVHCADEFFLDKAAVHAS